MNLLVDTSVWSLAFRRDRAVKEPPVDRLRRALEDGEGVFTTGLILQELLQVFGGPRNREALLSRFASLPLLVPDRTDHVEAAEIRNSARRRGVQIGTIDALLAQLAIRHRLTLLSTGRDFELLTRFIELDLWSS